MSSQPRKERKTLYTLPPHLRRKQLSAHLSEELNAKYGTRSVVVRKGDTVKVLRGDFKGTTGKIVEVDTKSLTVTVEGVTLETAKHAQKPRPVNTSNLLVTKLDLTDPRRRAKLGASEADVAAEDRAKPKMERRAKKETADEEEEK